MFTNLYLQYVINSLKDLMDMNEDYVCFDDVIKDAVKVTEDKPPIKIKDYEKYNEQIC